MQSPTSADRVTIKCDDCFRCKQNDVVLTFKLRTRSILLHAKYGLHCSAIPLPFLFVVVVEAIITMADGHTIQYIAPSSLV